MIFVFCVTRKVVRDKTMINYTHCVIESGGYLPSIVLGPLELPCKPCPGNAEVLIDFGFSGPEEVYRAYRDYIYRINWKVS